MENREGGSESEKARQRTVSVEGLIVEALATVATIVIGIR